MIGIAVFGLVTFTITGAVLQTFSKDGTSQTGITMTLPSGKKHEFTQTDRAIAATVFAKFYDTSTTQYGIPEFMLLGFMGGQAFPKLQSTMPKVSTWAMTYMNPSPWGSRKEAREKNDPATQIMIVNALARDQGIDVGITEVEEFISSAFETKDQYHNFCAVLKLNYAQFQLIIREAMLFRRAMDLALAQSPVPSGDEIVKEWSERNERYTFEAAAFPVADFEKSIDTKTVTTEDLKKWLDSLKEFEKGKYKEEEKIELEGIAVSDSGTKPGDAFEALVNGVVLEASDAQAFFDLARFDRYKKPKPAVDTASSAASSAATPEYFTFDEIKDRVMREVKVARALDKVREEAMSAMNQPAFSLKTIAEKYNLTYWTSNGPQTLAAIFELKDFGTTAWRVPLESAKVGEFLPGTQAASGAIEITRLREKRESKIPEITEIREKLLPDYVAAKSRDLAKDAAQKFKDAVNDATGDDRFQKVAKEKNVNVISISNLSKAARTDPDFIGDSSRKDAAFFFANSHTEGMNPGQAVRTDPFYLKKDAVGGPYDDTAQKIFYIARCVDRAFPVMKDMTPADYMRFRDSELGALRKKKCFDLLTTEALKKSLNISFSSRGGNQE